MLGLGSSKQGLLCRTVSLSVVVHGLSSCGESNLLFSAHGHWSARAQPLHSMWDLSLLTRDRTHAPRIATRILNHRTTREVPSSFIYWLSPLSRKSDPWGQGCLLTFSQWGISGIGDSARHVGDTQEIPVLNKSTLECVHRTVKNRPQMGKSHQGSRVPCTSPFFSRPQGNRDFWLLSEFNWGQGGGRKQQNREEKLG